MKTRNFQELKIGHWYKNCSPYNSVNYIKIDSIKKYDAYRALFYTEIIRNGEYNKGLKNSICNNSIDDSLVEVSIEEIHQFLGCNQFITGQSTEVDLSAIYTEKVPLKVFNPEKVTPKTAKPDLSIVPIINIKKR